MKIISYRTAGAEMFGYYVFHLLKSQQLSEKCTYISEQLCDSCMIFYPNTFYNNSHRLREKRENV